MSGQGGGSSWRRVAVVLLAYAAFVVLLLPFLDGLQRLLFLPDLFLTLAGVGLALGLPVALVLAWRFPDIGNG